MSYLKQIVENIEDGWRQAGNFNVESITLDSNGDYVVRVSTPLSRGEKVTEIEISPEGVEE